MMLLLPIITCSFSIFFFLGFMSYLQVATRLEIILQLALPSGRFYCFICCCIRFEILTKQFIVLPCHSHKNKPCHGYFQFVSQGHLRILVPRPTQPQMNHEKSFFAKLEFTAKPKTCFVKSCKRKPT